MGFADNMLQKESTMVVSGRSSMENGHCASHTGVQKYKQRTVSAVRDFPPTCGQFAHRIFVPGEEALRLVLPAIQHNDKSFDESSDCSLPASAMELNPPLVGLSPSLDLLETNPVQSKAEEQSLSFDLSNGIESMNLEPMGEFPPKAAEALYVAPAEASEGETAGASKDLRKVDAYFPAEETVPRNYPPRRRISVVRDFPPLCGRNSPCLGRGENSKLPAFDAKDISNEKLCNEEKPWQEQLRETLEGDVKQLGENSNAHNCKLQANVSQLTGNMVLVECNRPAAKEARNRLESRATDKNEVEVVQGDIQDQNIKHPRESIQTHPNHGGLAGKLKKKLADCMEELAGNEVVGLLEDKLQAETEGSDSRETVNKNNQIFSPRNEIKVAQEDIQERGISSPCKAIQNQRILEIAPALWEREILGLEENLGKDLVVSLDERGSEKELSDLLVCNIEKSGFNGSDFAVERVVVQGLMAEGYCPWSQGKRVYKPTNLAAGTRENKGKMDDFTLLESSNSAFKENNKQGENFGGAYAKKNSSFSGMGYQGIGAMPALDEKENPKSDEFSKFQLIRKPCNEGVNLPPSNPSGSSTNGDARNKVRETLRLFQAINRKLLQEEEAKVNGHGNTRRRCDLQAAKILKEKVKYCNTGKQIIGSVPGVEVGDEFQYWVELNIVGLHRPSQGGIDYLNQGMDSLATSIVASGSYGDDTDETDVLIYTGQGGNMNNGGKEPEDQELKRGNLALKNSRDAQNPVRVIRSETKVSDSRGKTYIYDGLYLVEKLWQELGPHGKLVYKFQLVRIPGQPELAWKVVKKSKKYQVRQGLCFDDISQGRESIAICAVNAIDDERPPPFEYVTHMIYPPWHRLIPPQGCDCNEKCFEGKCSCAAKNGGEIPYNHNGAIVETKPIVYECGPFCKCPPSCFNRVSQHGIKFQLEIFKTESRGWGVRSLNSIPSGSFICEYVGELLEEKEAEKRTGNDEYLFDIGHNCNDKVLWDGLSALMPVAQSSSCEVVQDGSFTIDAARCGNVGRFINHSCSPNLYAQNVLYDHEDERMPHIMLFSAENIPPLQELTYHYNYMIDQVLDSDGNIKKKSCYCGSSECTGRMY
uniref:Histone-lysine N-methyltransferase H3 lysine-9 specific SUVH6-like n=1 Tax=Rhizophora mucronata TaxID=61149 RepID=A0A2P2IMF6_RHIMU